jgi:hypothetical protein
MRTVNTLNTYLIMIEATTELIKLLRYHRPAFLMKYELKPSGKGIYQGANHSQCYLSPILKKEHLKIPSPPIPKLADLA